MLGTRLLRAAARLWWLKVYNGSGLVPVPRDSPSIRSGYPGADRVLLVGNGAAGGWHTASYGLALAGRLAAGVQHATGRGCDLDQVGDEVMNVRSAAAWIGHRSLADYDAVVMVIGMSDAVRLTSPAEWRAELTDLLERLLSGTRDGVRVVVATIEPVRVSRVFHGVFGLLAQRNADRLNAVTQEVGSGFDRVDVVELLEPDLGAEPGGPALAYSSWAGSLATPVAAALGPAGPPRAREALPALLTRRASPVAQAAEWDQIRGLLDDAKAEFRADVAWISVLEGDRYTVPVASIGNSPAEVPLDLTFCAHTMQQDGTMIVPDAKRDPRFAGNPFLEVVHFEFYAGHRLEDTAGNAVGTFCVASIRPRRASSVNPHSLAGYAQKAEAELGIIQDLPAPRSLPSAWTGAARG